MHIPKWLIATAGILVVALVAALAFFVGRESSRAPAESTSRSAARYDSASVADASPAPAPAPVEDAGGGTTRASDAPPTASASASAPAAPGAAADAGPVNADARVRVSDYLRQMDALQSGGPGGAPDAFAQTVLQGAASGDFSGLDDLVRAAGDAERRAQALQPPAECAEYHRMAVTLLQDGRTLITTLRDGLQRNDADALTALGASAQSMKSRTDTLAAAEKALRARYGL